MASFLTMPTHSNNEDLELLGDTFQINGEINLNTIVSNQNSNSTNLQDSYVELSHAWKDKVRSVIAIKLEEFFKDNEISFKDDFSLAEFIDEAYIEIREVNGTPIAIIIGKHQMAFGQNVQAMPVFAQNPTSPLQEIQKVFGLTVDLTEGLFGIFDQAEISVFETEDGDLKLGTIDGMSIRLSKMLTDNWLLTLSHAELGNGHLPSGNERKTSVGLIGESMDGNLVGWIENTIFSDNPDYPNSDFSISAGVMVKVHDTTDVIVEYNYIERELSQIALGSRTGLTENLTLGIEVRYNNYINGKPNEITFGTNLNWAFGNTDEPVNEYYIFDHSDDNEEDFFEEEE